MTRCERFETDVSAMLDGELTPAATLTTIDHLLQCSSCRAFYHGGRHLERALENVLPADDRLPPGLWDRILGDAERRGDEDRVVPLRRSHPFRRWLVQAAAVLLVAVGGWWVGRAWTGPASGQVPREGVVQVVVEADRGSMDEDRFLRLASELLRADRRYHLKMQEILTAVNRRTFTPEGGGEGAMKVNEKGLLRAGLDQGGDGTTEPARIWY